MKYYHFVPRESFAEMRLCIGLFLAASLSACGAINPVVTQAPTPNFRIPRDVTVIAIPPELTFERADSPVEIDIYKHKANQLEQ